MFAFLYSTTAPTQDPTPSDLRNIMQAQANVRSTPSKKSSGAAMKSPSPLGKKSQKQRKRELALQFATVTERAVGAGGDAPLAEEKSTFCPWYVK